MEYWTRVIPLRDFNAENIKLYDLRKDLEQDRQLKLIRQLTSSTNGRAIFDPDAYRNSDYNFNVDSHKLTEDQLREYAQIITQIRRELSQKAAEAILNSESDEEESDAEVVEPPRNLYRNYTKYRGRSTSA